MKKMNYEAPQIELVRFETDDVLATLVPSGVGEAPEVGGITFGGGTRKVDLF